jgi:hypothetical protein
MDNFFSNISDKNNIDIIISYLLHFYEIAECTFISEDSKKKLYEKMVVVTDDDYYHGIQFLEQEIRPGGKTLQRKINGKLQSFNSPALIVYDEENILHKRWYKNGLVHRDGDDPAYISYSIGRLYLQCWYKNGKLHRDDDKPAYIYYCSENIRIEKWYKNGNQYRINNLPTELRYLNGNVIKKTWRNEQNVKHREMDLPAVILKTDQPEYIQIEWYNNGLCERENNKPARIKKNLGEFEIDWRLNGLCHRTNGGPAQILNGNSFSMYNWIEYGVYFNANPDLPTSITIDHDLSVIIQKFRYEKWEIPIPKKIIKTRYYSDQKIYIYHKRSKKTVIDCKTNIISIYDHDKLVSYQIGNVFLKFP